MITIISYLLLYHDYYFLRVDYTILGNQRISGGHFMKYWGGECQGPRKSYVRPMVGGTRGMFPEENFEIYNL